MKTYKSLRSLTPVYPVGKKPNRWISYGYGFSLVTEYVESHIVEGFDGLICLVEPGFFYKVGAKTDIKSKTAYNKFFKNSEIFGYDEIMEKGEPVNRLIDFEDEFSNYLFIERFNDPFCLAIYTFDKKEKKIVNLKSIFYDGKYPEGITISDLTLMDEANKFIDKYYDEENEKFRPVPKKDSIVVIPNPNTNVTINNDYSVNNSGISKDLERELMAKIMFDEWDKK